MPASLQGYIVVEKSWNEVYAETEPLYRQAHKRGWEEGVIVYFVSLFSVFNDPLTDQARPLCDRERTFFELRAYEDGFNNAKKYLTLLSHSWTDEQIKVAILEYYSAKRTSKKQATQLGAGK